MEATDKLSIRELSFQDDSFDIQSLGNYNLYLSIGQDGLEICVIDTVSNRCLFLEHYSFYVSLSHDQLTSHLNWIYDNHLFLKAYRWNQIKIAHRGKAFTLVPKALFDEDEAVQYLKHLTDVRIDQTICYSYIESIDAMNVFLVEKELIEWFEQIYTSSPKLTFVHQTAGLIEGLQAQKRKNLDELSNIYLHIEPSYLILTIFKERNLEFCNVFPFSTEQDFLYYVLLVIDELRYFPDKIMAELSGGIEKDYGIYRLLDKYIQQVDISLDHQAMPWVTFGPKFEKAPLYQYFDLFSLHI